MARMARVVVPDYPHHITQRGNRRQKTFFCADDYNYYIKLLSEYSRLAKTAVWAYCLMPNHVHLVMVPNQEDGLRSAIGECHRRYTRHINLREGWRGHLWQERFHSFVMDEAYLLATVKYVERNPVAAGLCQHAEQWRWSSARAHLNGSDDMLVNVRPMLDRVKDWGAYLSDTTDLSAKNAMIKRYTLTGRPLGSDEFVKQLERLTGKSLAPRKRGRKATGRK